MIETFQETKTGAAAEAQVLAFDRRRSGRQEVSPVLVPLLRGRAVGLAGLDEPMLLVEHPFCDVAETDTFQDQLGPARGIAVGLSVSMLFWGVVGYAIFR